MNHLNLIEGAFGLNPSLQTALPCKMSRFSVPSIQALFLLGYFLLTLFMAYHAQEVGEGVIGVDMVRKRKLVTMDEVGFLISIFPLIMSAFFSVKLIRVRESLLSPTYHARIGANDYLFSEEARYASFFAALELDNQNVLSYFSKEANTDYMKQWVAAGLTVNVNTLMNKSRGSHIMRRLRAAHQLFQVDKNNEVAFTIMQDILVEQPDLISIIFEQLFVSGDDLLNDLMPIVNNLKKQSVSLWSSSNNAPLTLEQRYYRQLDAVHVLKKNDDYIRLSRPFCSTIPADLAVRPYGEGVRLWDTMSYHQKRFHLEAKGIKSCCF